MRAAVLLVDDDEFTRCFARTVLVRSGFRVHEVPDIESAIAVAETETLAAAVTDWNLLQGNGGDLARTLHDLFPALPIVLMTGEVEGSSYISEQALGEFASVVYKPFSPSALENAVRGAIEQVPSF